MVLFLKMFYLGSLLWSELVKDIIEIIVFDNWNWWLMCVVESKLNMGIYWRFFWGSG